MGSASTFNARLADAFATAIDLPPQERQALLDRLHAADPSLRMALERLLAADTAIETGAADDPLVGPVAARRAAMDPAVFPGFQVLRPLGSGTAGTVYEAQQRRPNRRVAIKLLHEAPSTADDFWHEADVLGQVRHPGVAQVYAADATADGRCYLVMELVEGLPITEHAAAHGLRPDACVRLILQVCEAIDAVHRLGVVHRDLKPANVLVDVHGRAKIVDFGIAALATPDPATPPAGSTMVGTLAYMSPERLSATTPLGGVDARSDVYSIGVLLYELLTRRLPIDLRGVPLGEVAARVGRVRPPPLGRMVPACRGDLEAIVGRAMEKDPARRYASAAALADDLTRYLSRRPIAARRPTLARRMNLFVRRHRTASVVALTAIVLAAAVALAIRSADRSRQRSYAASIDSERRRQQQLARATLYESLIGLAGNAAESGQPARAAALLNEAAGRPEDGPDLRGWEWHYLWRVTHPPFTAFENQHNEARCVAVSADGKLLASGGSDGQVQIYDLDAEPVGRPRFSLSGHTALVTSVDFSPDGATLMSTDFNGRLLRWDTKTGLFLPAPPPRPDTQSMGATFRPDGRSYAQTLINEGLFVFDARDNAPVMQLTVPGEVLSNQPAWSPDGRQVAVCDSDGVLHVWPLGTDAEGRPERDGPPIELPISGGWQSAVAFDPTGRTVAVSCGDGVVRVIDVQTRTEKFVLRGHDTWVTDVAFSRDGTQVATASRDQTVRLWDAGTGAPLHTLGGHSAWVMGVTFDAQGRAISAGFNSEVRRWEVSGPGDLRVRRQDLDCLALGIALPPTGDQVAVLTKTGDVVRTRSRPISTTAPATSTAPPADGAVFALRPDGRQVLRAVPGTTPRIIDASAGVDVPLASVARPVRAAAFDPGGGPTLVVATTDGLQVLNADDGRERTNAVAFPGADVVAVSPGASKLAVAAERLMLLTLRGERLTETVSIGLPDRALALAFSAGGRRVAVASNGGHLRCFDADNGQPLWSMNAHPSDFTSLAFSPDSRRLLASTGEGVVQVHDAATGRVLLTLNDSVQIRVMGVAWSADGMTANAVNFVGQLFQWEAAAPAGSRP